ncbi:AAA family ATPase [Dietzia sp. KRD202]|uniref:AAA family ATPase n=1 Tax=Dietzia sp. KRD202 TaxID=2729732 RepID=UPI0019D23B25|nr:AAA family ATPase [Dietzia sp. KRD202]
MKLHSIILKNFRQFKGRQTFDLRSDKEKSVNLLFGANGAGKTTLLNAFTWALYGAMSDDVEQQDRLITDTVWRKAATGDTVEVYVEITFEHGAQDYRILRSIALRKEGDYQGKATPEVQLWTTRPDGTSEVVRAPQEHILSILPRSISRFFFFNGERIEKLVEKSAYSEVQKDIKVLLALEQVERALTHLPKVDRKLTADIRKYGGDKASEIQAAIDQLRENESELREEQKILESTLADLNDEREQVTDLLRQHDAAAPIQQQRDLVEKKLSEARSGLQLATAERATLIATRGFLAFTEHVCQSTNEIASALYRKGALPAPLKREFVDKLLDDGVCICGTELADHSEAWQKVTAWRQRAGLQAVETAWQKLSGQIEPMSSARNDLRDGLGQIMKRIGKLRDSISELEETMSELDGKLRDSRMEDVQALESKRIDLEARHGEKQRRIGAVAGDLQRIQRDIEQRVKERKGAEVTDDLASKARARSDMVQNVRKALEEILEIRSEEKRQELDAKLKEIYGKITFKNYIPALNESFELTLHSEEDGVKLPVPKSTGENQVLSLSFVAAVSQVAQENRKNQPEEMDSGADSGIYPIVMDAAFGSLDENYQKEVTRALATLAPQLLVLVSKSQGLGKVVTELSPYVSHLGVIEAHSSLPGATNEDIELNGHAYPYIRSDETDFALLKEIQ